MRPAILITAAIKKIQLKSRPKSLQKKMIKTPEVLL